MDGDKWVAHLSRILVDVAAGRAELPCICQPDDQSSNCLWSDHQVDDRQVGNDEVRPRMRTGGETSQQASEWNPTGGVVAC
jgi:hypothetical protein